MYYISAVVGFIGIGLAWFFHLAGRTQASTSRMDGFAAHFGPVPRWAENKWLVDEFYHFIIVTPLRVISHLFHWFDKLVIDGIVELFGGVPKAGSETLGPATQTGVLHDYALRMIAGTAVVLAVVALVLY
jgi:NADH-quinone oxidoreductase subunit L